MAKDPTTGLEIVEDTESPVFINEAGKTTTWLTPLGGEVKAEGTIIEETTWTASWFQLKGADDVVDIDEEKQWPVVESPFTEDSITDILSKKPGDQTETEKAMLRKFQAKKAFNLGKGLDAFGNRIWGTETVAPTWSTEWETLLSSWWLEDALNKVKNLNDNMARSSLGSEWFTPSQIDQIMLRRGTESAIGKKQEEVDLRLETAKSDISNRGEKRMNTLDRGLSFSWFGRSSVAIEKRDELQQSINNEIRQAQAKADLEVQLFKAQQEWAEGEIISAISANLAKASAALKKTESENAIAAAKASQELWLKANEALDNFLAATWIEDKEDFTWDVAKTKELWLGYFVDSSWNVVVDENNKPIVYKQPEAAEKASKAPNVQFVAAKSDDFGNIIQPSGYFNKDTQEFHAINYGGNSDEVEFPWKDSIESPIAEYTQIYKWSTANPNWIDLAGKKWSSINTPIAGEVVFVWDNWGWGNQVKIKDASWQVHQFSHLDSSLLTVWQNLTRWAMVGTMGNTWNVLKGDGSKPSPEELAAGRGTHLDYTVYDNNGDVMGLDVAMWYAWVDNTSGKTSTTSEAIAKWYKNPSQIKIYNQILKEGGTPPNLSNQNLNAWQSNAVWFATRMADDIEILRSGRQAIKDLSVFELASYRKAYWTSLWNQFVPANIQKFLQAERDFIQAQLRKESGAAIPTTEIDSFIKTNGITPGDSDEVIDQKFNNLENMLQSMIISAWPWASSVNVPDWLDQDDVWFFWEEGGSFDAEDEDFFNNL